VSKNDKFSWELSDIHPTIEFLNSIGYKGSFGDEKCNETTIYIIETKELVIGVFPEGYPHEVLRGKIAVEFKKCFNKWSQAYYVRNFPKSDRDRRTIESELEELVKNKEHFERSHVFKTFPFNDR